MEIVSFETAKRLKEAGFPQPEFEAGQVWWMNVDPYGFIPSLALHPAAAGSEEWRFAMETDMFIVEGDCDKEECFAPTATEILRELAYYDIHFDTNRQKWCCWLYHEDTDVDDKFHENPAEACAAAYLFYHSIS